MDIWLQQASWMNTNWLPLQVIDYKETEWRKPGRQTLFLDEATLHCLGLVQDGLLWRFICVVYWYHEWNPYVTIGKQNL